MHWGIDGEGEATIGRMRNGDPRDERQHVIGLISDTHGLVRPDVFSALAGVELILHAGDVGGDDVLHELGTIAPVLAVYGNTDTPGDPRLAGEVERMFGGIRVHVSHGHEVGAPTPEKLLATYSADVLVYGHTHRQLVVQAGERWVVNPGAAGPRRFDIRPSVGRLVIEQGRVTIEIVELQP
jgi:putative phosphoesterase